MREASFVQILVPLMDTSYCRMYCYDMVFKPFIIWSMYLICCFQMTGRLVMLLIFILIFLQLTNGCCCY